MMASSAPGKLCLGDVAREVPIRGTQKGKRKSTKIQAPEVPVQSENCRPNLSQTERVFIHQHYRPCHWPDSLFIYSSLGSR